MLDFIVSLLVFIIIYLFYLFTVILRKKKLERFKNSSYVKYLENIYHINIKKIDMKKLAKRIALTNSFIVSFTLFIVQVTESFILKLLLAVVIFIPLQLLFYHLIGKNYQKKQRRK